MKKEDKELISYVIKKELKNLENFDDGVIFPNLNFLKSETIYRKKLQEILKKL